MKPRYKLGLLFIVLLLQAPSAFAMHISEGILPVKWSAFGYLMALPFVLVGSTMLKKKCKETPQFTTFIAIVGAMVFVVSAMAIPIPIAGTSSHPAGTGMAAVLLGPFMSVIAAAIALLLQALFLAHGGITTLGANILSMGVAGSFSAYFVFKILRRFNVSLTIAAFAAGVVADWATYAITSLQLAVALQTKGSALLLFKKIIIAFMPTQIPLGLIEGALTAGFFSFVLSKRPEILVDLKIIKKEEITNLNEVSETVI